MIENLKSLLKDWGNKIFNESVEYLENFSICGIPVLKTPRKMLALAVGFIVTIKSLKALASELLLRDINILNYFLMYKFSKITSSYFSAV